MPRWKSLDGVPVGDEELAALVEPFGLKLHWFLEHGYSPHLYQTLFHCMNVEGRLQRFRHLVAGRRGGKTLSAAWEVLFYATHPAQFHWDFHNEQDDRPLWIWVLTKDYKAGRPALLTFRDVLRKAGFENGRDYKENRGELYFEFPDGTLIEFKTATDPQSLRGAGLDLLWMDEAAFIPDREAFDVVRPALSDKLGGVIGTTTPDGKNWVWEEWWGTPLNTDREIGSVEYRSIDNPYFSREEWEYLKRTYHPLLFKREYEASFDAMEGVELSGDWLHYYVYGDPGPGEITIPIREEDGRKILPLRKYIGVDPAISLSDTADRFAITCIGVTEDNTQAFILDQYADRIPFPDQIDVIRTWFHKWRPDYIGIEAQAYQRALVQQAERMQGLPPIIPIFSQGKKSERILSMAPVFKLGIVRLLRTHNDFINEWLSYDSTLRNPKDDVLDSTEIALRSAGALLPQFTELDEQDRPAAGVEELAERDLSGHHEWDSFDENLGAEW